MWHCFRGSLFIDHIVIAQLIEFLKSWGSLALPFVVVDQWQGGVILRLGLFRRTATPGFHWKWPFMETAQLYSTVVTTTALDAQSIMAEDRKVYTVEGVVRWRVDDVKPFACDIWDGENVIIDSAKSAIAETVRNEGVADISTKVTTKSRRTLKKYGIYVEEVTITTLAPIRCLRLIGAGVSIV